LRPNPSRCCVTQYGHTTGATSTPPIAAASTRRDQNARLRHWPVVEASDTAPTAIAIADIRP
jgi:hypothetical protein